MKEKLNPLVEEYRRRSLYIIKFCETRKIILKQFEYFSFFSISEKGGSAH